MEDAGNNRRESLSLLGGFVELDLLGVQKLVCLDRCGCLQPQEIAMWNTRQSLLGNRFLLDHIGHGTEPFEPFPSDRGRPIEHGYKPLAICDNNVHNSRLAYSSTAYWLPVFYEHYSHKDLGKMIMERRPKRDGVAMSTLRRADLLVRPSKHLDDGVEVLGRTTRVGLNMDNQTFVGIKDVASALAPR